MTVNANEADNGVNGQTDGIGKNQQGGENGNENGSIELETFKKELEELKKGNSSKDAKIAEYQAKIKEFQKKDFSKKTVEEQLEEFKRKNIELEQKEAFSKAFKGNGLDVDLFRNIVNEQSYEVQAEKFRKLLDEKIKQASDKAVEDFKTEQLKNVKRNGPGGEQNKDANGYDPNNTPTKKTWNKWK